MIFEGLRPAHDWMIVKLMRPKEQKTDGGIVLPNIKGEDETFEISVGEVLKAGPGYWHEAGTFIENPFRGGEYIAFNKLAGISAEENNKNMLLIRSEDVFLSMDRETAEQIIEL